MKIIVIIIYDKTYEFKGDINVEYTFQEKYWVLSKKIVEI